MLFVPRERLGVADWARRYLRVTDGPLVGEEATPVAWNPAAFPLQEAVIRAIDDPRWNKVVLLTCPQAFGKTLCAAVPVLLHGIEHRRCDVVYVAANADLANTVWKTKIKKAIQSQSRLAALLPENPDLGGNRLERIFTNGRSMHIVGSESVGNLSGKTAPVVVCDDVHAYGTLPKFGHPADYAATRTGSFPAAQCTLIYAGTAGMVDDWLWRTLSASSCYLPFVPCPRCGRFQLIEFARFRFDDQDPQAAAEDTWMQCANPTCEMQIRFEHLPALLPRHLWYSPPAGADWVLQPPEGGTTIDPDPVNCFPHTARATTMAGFWANALYWPWGRSWGQWAAEWIHRRGEPDKVRDFTQNVLAQPYKIPEIDEQRITEEEMAQHGSAGFTARTVPAQADVVTVTVDIQSGYIYYLVRAWRRRDGESWLVDLGTVGKPLRHVEENERDARRVAGITAALDQVDELTRRGWDRVDDDGGIIGHATARLGLIDRGYEPDIVGSWWVAKHRGVWMLIKGLAAGLKGALWPRRPKRDPRGRLYREVNVNQAKHLLRELWRIGSQEGGYWHMPESGLHANTVRAYYRHVSSERFNRQLKIPRWEKIRPGAANHFLDCEVYQIAAAIALGVRLAGEAVPRPARRMTSSSSPTVTMPDGRPFVSC